eukprot:2894450-Rhodomonas_salina.4
MCALSSASSLALGLIVGPCFQTHAPSRSKWHSSCLECACRACALVAAALLSSQRSIAALPSAEAPKSLDVRIKHDVDDTAPI